MLDDRTADLLAALARVLPDAGGRFAAMLRKVPDPAALAIGEWSVAETAAHVAASGPFFLAVARGDCEPEGLDDVDAANAAALAADPERNLHVLAGRIESGERMLAAYLSTIDGDPEVEVFRGVVAPLSTLAAVEATEILVHGWDIARAARLPWWMARDESGPIVTALLGLLPHLVDPQAAAGLDARFEIRVRGGGRRVLAFEDGSAHLEEVGGAAAACRLSIDPGTYLLLGFRRIGNLRAVLTGKLAAWGRRPWLAVRFPSLFKGF